MIFFQKSAIKKHLNNLDKKIKIIDRG